MELVIDPTRPSATLWIREAPVARVIPVDLANEVGVDAQDGAVFIAFGTRDYPERQAESVPPPLLKVEVVGAHDMHDDEPLAAGCMRLEVDTAARTAVWRWAMDEVASTRRHAPNLVAHFNRYGDQIAFVLEDLAMDAAGDLAVSVRFKRRPSGPSRIGESDRCGAVAEVERLLKAGRVMTDDVVDVANDGPPESRQRERWRRPSLESREQIPPHRLPPKHTLMANQAIRVVPFTGRNAPL